MTLDTFDSDVIAHLVGGLTHAGARVAVHELRAPTERDAQGPGGNEKVIVAGLPYLVYTPGSRVLDGPGRVTGGSAKERTLQLTFVGATREQAIAAGDAAQNLLHDRRVISTGSRLWWTQRTALRVDDIYTGEGNVPLVYGSDFYSFAP